MTHAISRWLVAIAVVLAILPRQPSAAQDAVKVQPQSYRVVLDNERMRVVEYNARPGFGVCGSGRHSHPAHLTVLLTPAKVRVAVGGRVMVVQMPAGQSFWEPAMTHEVENIGGANVRSLLIEPKTPRGAGLNWPARRGGATAVIAEDETVLRADLRDQLAELWPDLQVLASASNGVEALAMFERHRPTVMFLDIEMPGLTGLDVARQIGGNAISCSSQLLTRTPSRLSSTAQSTIC